MEELAFAITNDLCNKLGCEQVALGMVAGSRVNVVSISGMDTVRHQSPGVVSLRSAMEEGLDAGEPIVFQRAGGWTSDEAVTGHRLHKQWHAAVQGDAVASIPLRTGEQVTAILSLRKRAGEPFTASQIEDIRARVEAFIPALILTRRASRGLLRHTRDSVFAGAETLIRPGRSGAKLGAAAAVVFALWFSFGSTDYDLTIPCVVKPTHIRHVTAPFDGVLLSASVIEGDYVKRGEVLGCLDRRELDQERAQLLAELAVLERTHDRAMADDSPAEARLALANQQLIQAKLDVVNQRIENATLKAPIDGVIVFGDLRKQIGSVVTRGDPFYEVAPLDSWTLELEVPESASADLRAGLGGFFASYARPEETRRLTVRRVLPEAQIREGRNVYVAEAEVSAPADWLRPGLEGVAKIDLGRRRVWWVVLHRAVDYLRMKLWL
jgi:multidrug efflux pump subunit AcrA (membrane-fusion protein)